MGMPFWGMLGPAIAIVFFMILSYVVASIEPIWRFWTWFFGTVVTSGKAVTIVALILVWLECSDRALTLIKTMGDFASRAIR
jgi:hypothetical protein